MNELIKAIKSLADEVRVEETYDWEVPADCPVEIPPTCPIHMSEIYT